MGQERPELPSQPKPEDAFGFTEHERLFDRVSHDRLLALLDDEATAIHRVEESYNNYGEFIFITLSRAGENRRTWVTFFGAGFHEHRERWLIDTWFWYRANPLPESLHQPVTKEEARERLQQRLEEIGPYASQDTQTKRGKLFEALADLSDDDAAMIELEDLGDLADWLADGLE